MDNIGVKDFIYIITIAVTVVATFFGTRHKIKEYVRDKFDILNDKINSQKDLINELKIEIEKLRSKNENQQQIIDQFQKQVLDHLPALFQIIKEQKGGEQNGR